MENRGWSPDRNGDLSLLHRAGQVPGPDQLPIQKEPRSLCHGDKRLKRRADQSLHIMHGLKFRRAIPKFPTFLHGVNKNNFTLICTKIPIQQFKIQMSICVLNIVIMRGAHVCKRTDHGSEKKKKN